MSTQQEIKTIEMMIIRWKAMARQYYHNKDYTNATLCRNLRMMAVEEINRLKEQ